MSRRASALAFVAGALVLGAASSAGAVPEHHGVDPVGRYIYKDAASPYGPAIDPEPATDALAFDDADEGTVDVVLPFSFDLYDVTRTTITVGVNGVVAFLAGQDLPATGRDLAADDGPPAVAPWWFDWELGAVGSVSTNTFGPAVDQTFVVRWHVRPVTGTEDDYVDFELLLREREDLIEFQYVDTTTLVGVSDGAMGTIGLRGLTDGGRFPYAFDENEAVLDPAGFAIRWTPVFCHGARATRLGTFGNDTIEGTPGRDVIVALSGSDRVFARRGNDVVCGSRSADRIDGGKGRDQLWGEFAPDIILGGDGQDFLIGGGGNDLMIGGPGDDRCAEISRANTTRSCEIRNLG